MTRKKKAFGKVAKIVIAKTIGKKRKSTRKISQMLKKKGFQTHMTVHSYLRKNLGLKPYKLGLLSRDPGILD